MVEILSTQEASVGLREIARQLVERCGGASELALVGIRRGGTPLAAHLAELIAGEHGVDVPIGAVDITIYRDDAPTPLAHPRIGRSELPFEVSEKRIVLVDDVLYTGRTVRAAMHALLEYGRSRSIVLAVLVDRGGRELPIQADFVVKRVEVEHPRRVEVLVDDDGFRAEVVDQE